MRRISHSLSLGIAVVACLVCGARAPAATITPSTAADDYDAVTPDGNCSLREAVQSAEQGSNFGGCIAGGAYTGADTVELNPGNYVLTILPTGGNDLSSGDLNLGVTDLTVEGPPSGAPGGATIDGFGADRVINCFAGAGSLTLRDLTITDGAISLSGTGNSAPGGGILSNGCPLTITESTITGNVADGSGAGLSTRSPTSLRNVTVSNNFDSEFGGGGIAVLGPSATLSLDHATISDNHAQVTSVIGGGGLLVDSDSTATAHNSIIAGNIDESTTDAPDCQGALTSTGGNVIGDTTGCTFGSLASDAINMNAMLGSLMNNGGTTMTHALLVGSPAIDHAVGASPLTDQRGFARPFPVGGLCDSGAYEFGASLSADTPGCQPPPVPPPPPSTSGSATAVNPLCATLRKKLRKAKEAHNKPKVRKLKRKLRRLGC
jgi:CSLREA domain-containing protein